MTYRIVRFYFSRPGTSRTIKRGLTLKQAQAHCHDPETSSSTALSGEAHRRTLKVGQWFDGYTEED